MEPLVLLAEQAPSPAAGGSAGGVVQFLVDHPFAVGLAFLFLVAVVAAFIAARKRDRCLKKFRGFPVTLTEQSGRRIWGWLKVFPAGVELVYETPLGRPAKRSFLMYEGDLGRLLSIARFTDRLGSEHAAERKRQAGRLAHPGPLRRLGRWARNIVNTFRDAIVKAMGMTVQQAAQASPNPVLQAQGGQINAIGTLLIGETANAYEPMIEQYVNRPVILETVNPADPQRKVTEHHGTLGEYSAQFVLLVDVRRRFTETVPMDGQTRPLLEDTVQVRADGRTIRVANGSAVPVEVEGVTAGGGACIDVGRVVAPGETAEVTVPGQPGAGDDGTAGVGTPAPTGGGDAEGPAAIFSWQRTFDLIVPRSVGIIRHASEPAG